MLITGGTVSLGKEMDTYLLNETNVRRVFIYSRDQLKHHDLRITSETTLDFIGFWEIFLSLKSFTSPKYHYQCI